MKKDEVVGKNSGTDAQQKTDLVNQRKRMAMGAPINGQAYNGNGNTPKVKHSK